MRIGELAARTGASVRALRYYEERRLLESERSPTGQRLYSDGAVERVRLIRRLYAAGVPSASIVDLLACAADGEATPELLERLAAERDRIEGRIGDLVDARDRLDVVIAAATDNLRTGRHCDPR